MGARLSDSGADWDAYEQACSSKRSKPAKRLHISAEAALARIKAIALREDDLRHDADLERDGPQE